MSSDAETDFLRKRLLELDKLCTEQSERIVVLEKQLEHEVFNFTFAITLLILLILWRL